MDFREFWTRLIAELARPKKFETLKLSRRFEAVRGDHDAIVITPDQCDYRSVSIKEFRSMWDIMKNDARRERYVNTNKRYYSFWNSSYVSALIDHIVSDQDME